MNYEPIYVTGDLHGSDQIYNVVRAVGNEGTLLIMGDFGYLFDPIESAREAKYLNFMANCNMTFAFVDGNHENFVRLEALPTVKRFGSDVGEVRHNVFHLRRGRKYEIGYKSFLAMGGATSVDKDDRVPMVSWWPQEVPSWEDWEQLYKTIKENDGEFDYFLTHSPPAKLYPLMGILPMNSMKTYDIVARKFDDLFGTIKLYNGWFCGHAHRDMVHHIDGLRLRAVYNDIVQLTP